MKHKPILTIRISSDEDTVTVDGVQFDRSKMSKNDKYLMRRVIVDTLFPRKGH